MAEFVNETNNEDLPYIVPWVQKEMVSCNVELIPSQTHQCSLLSARVVWLDTEHEYITTHKDTTCIDGQCIKIRNVCWVQMGQYNFPPIEFDGVSLPAGRYYIGFRIKTSANSRFYGGLNFNFKIKPTDRSNSNDQQIKLSLELCEIKEVTKEKWRLLVLGHIILDQQSTVELNIMGQDGRIWKCGHYWDYVELIPAQFVVPPLQSLCSQVVSKALDGRSKKALELPSRLEAMIKSSDSPSRCDEPAKENDKPGNKSKSFLSSLKFW